MEAVGLSETRDLLTRLTVELEQDLPGLDGLAQRACCEAYRMVEDQIPVDTGALKKSLTRYRDRAQVFTPTADGYDFGSALPQATWQRKRLPDADPAPLLDALADALADAVEGA